MDFLLLSLAFYSIRSSEGIAYQPLFVTLLATSISLFWSVLRFFLFAFNVSGSGASAPQTPWQFYFYCSVFIGAPLVYAIFAVICNYLHRDLRSVMQEMTAELMGQGGREEYEYEYGNAAAAASGAAGQFGYSDEFDGMEQSYSFGSGGRQASPTPAPVSQQSFRPFVGQGHKIGD